LLSRPSQTGSGADGTRELSRVEAKVEQLERMVAQLQRQNDQLLTQVSQSQRAMDEQRRELDKVMKAITARISEPLPAAKKSPG
jgi:septal ring factor EnvC (AmiA/AmiB activator)